MMEQQQSKAIKKSSPSNDKQKKFLILVIEDSEVNQIVTCTILKKLGCKIELAKTGQEALKMLLKRKYDLVFVDLGLPDIHGFDVTSQFRSQEDPSQRTPMIALTAFDTAEAKQRSFEAGMDEFLIKPIILEQIQAVLRRWLIK